MRTPANYISYVQPTWIFQLGDCSLQKADCTWMELSVAGLPGTWICPGCVAQVIIPFACFSWDTIVCHFSKCYAYIRFRCLACVLLCSWKWDPIIVLCWFGSVWNRSRRFARNLNSKTTRWFYMLDMGSTEMLVLLRTASCAHSSRYPCRSITSTQKFCGRRTFVKNC